MAEEFADKVLRSSIAQLCLPLGWQNANVSALDVTSDVTKRFVLKIGSVAAKFAEIAARQEGNLEDLALALQSVGVGLPSLQEYVDSVEQPGCAHKVYQFPAKHPCSHVFEAQRHSTSSCTRQTKETATAVDGDGGSDSDSDDDVIPPYLPPLPKKEINEDDDDRESGIHVSDGETMDTDSRPCGPTSPGQSGLPQYWHKRLRSFSVDEDDRSCGSPMDILSPPTTAGIQSPPTANIAGGQLALSIDEILSRVARDPKYKTDSRTSTKGLPIAGKHPAAPYSGGGGRPRKEKSALTYEDSGKMTQPTDLKVPVLKIKPLPPPKQPEEGGHSSTLLPLQPQPMTASPIQPSQVESIREHQVPTTFTAQALPAMAQTQSQIVVSSHSQIEHKLESNFVPVQELSTAEQSGPSQEPPGSPAGKGREDTGASEAGGHASLLVANVGRPDETDTDIQDDHPDQGGDGNDGNFSDTRSNEDEAENAESDSTKDDKGGDESGAMQAEKEDNESTAGQSNDDIDVESLDVPFSETRDSPDATASLRDLSVSDTSDSSAVPSPLPPHGGMHPTAVHDINEESRLSFTDTQTSMHHVLDVAEEDSPVPGKMTAEKAFLHLSSSSTSSSVSSFSELGSLPDAPLLGGPGASMKEEDKGSEVQTSADEGDEAADANADATTSKPVASTPPGLIVQSMGTVTTSPLIVTIKKKYFKKVGGKKKKGQAKRKRDSSPKKASSAPKRAKLFTESVDSSLASPEAGATSNSPTTLADDKTVTPVTSVPGLLVTRTSSATTTTSSLFQERDILKSTPPSRRKDSTKQGLTTTTVSGSRVKSSVGRSSSDKASKLGPVPSRKKARKEKTPRSIKKSKTPSPSRLTVSTSAVKQVSPLVISSLSHTASPGLTVSSNPDYQVTTGRTKPTSRVKSKPGSAPKLTITSNEAKSTVLFPRSPAKTVKEQDSSSSGSDSNDDDQSDSSSSISMATASSVSKSTSGLIVHSSQTLKLPPTTSSALIVQPSLPVSQSTDVPLVYYCPVCNQPDDGRPMVACDRCDDRWFHWVCVGLEKPPPDDVPWFCPDCRKKSSKRKAK